MSIYTREKSSQSVQIFFAGTSLALLLDTIDTSGSNFIISFCFFQHRNKTKAMNFTKHTREISLLHILSHKCLKSLNFIILWFGGRSSSLGICKSSFRLNDEDDDIFEPERRFSGVFNF